MEVDCRPVGYEKVVDLEVEGIHSGLVEAQAEARTVGLFGAFEGRTQKRVCNPGESLLRPQYQGGCL